jgi:hypothetical protein
VFSGSFGDHASGGWFPAHAEVSQGFISLWVELPTGWHRYFSVTAPEVTVKSAGQRITLVVHGQSFVLLADPRMINRANRHAALGIAANVLDKPVFGAGVDVNRAINVAGAAHSFTLGGGPEFVAAARQSGARTSRMGYGPLLALGCGGGILLVFAISVVTLLAIGL